jgi:DNA-binding transcriptional ArsR family regulator
MSDDAPAGEVLDVPFGDVATATEAFGLLADETRLRILLALAEAGAMADFEGPESMSFGELRRAVGVEDTGRFNYHLGKLRDHFVHKSEAGYTLSYAGYRVTTDVASGVYHGESPTLAAETDVPCLLSECERMMAVTYEDGFVTLSCPEDDHPTTFQTALPPNAAVGRDPLALLTIATRDARHMIEELQAGTCPFCWSSVQARICADEPLDGGPALTVECENCWLDLMSPVTVLAVHHPAVQTAYAAADYALDETPYLAYPFVRRPACATIRDRDPLRVTVDTDPDGDVGAPVLVYDEELTVVAVE